MPSEMLSNVIGAPFKQYVIDQLNLRAANNSSSQRTDEQLLFLANKMSWTRLTSSVRVNPRDQNAQKFYANLFDGEVVPGGYTTPDALAKNWILQGGTSQYDKGNYSLRYGFGPDGAYGLGGTQQQGYRPMPGIDSVNIESKGTLGSLREATISFKVWNIVQLNVIEALYFRLGYTMLLEWGHVNYFNNKGQFVTTAEGIDIFNPKLNSKEAVLQLITQKNRQTSGNYEAMLGTVTNFYFSFNAEGGFDCNVKLIGLGSVIDTVRINQTFVMPDSLFVKVQQQQALVQQKVQQDRDDALKAKDAQDRTTQGLSPTLIDIVKNADGIKTVYEASKGVKPPANFLDTVKFPSSQYSAADGSATYDYFYKAVGGKLPNYDAELNNQRTGLFLSPNAKGRTWQVIPASFSSQEVTLNTGNLKGLADRNVPGRYAQNIGLDKIKVGSSNVDLQLSYSIANNGANSKDLTVLANNVSWYLSLANTGVTDWIQKQDEQVGKSFYTPFPYTVTTAPGVVSQKFFAIYYEAKSGNGDTTRQVLEAIENWVNNPKITIDFLDTVTIPGDTSNAYQWGSFIGYRGTFEGVAKDGVKVQFTFISNDTGLIQTVGAATTKQNAVQQVGGTVNPTGDTAGAQNESTPSQTAESSKFNSALHAMLIAVKAQGQSEGLNSSKAVIEVDLTENTKIFYQFGVLKNVLNTTPTVGAIDQFDVTTYGQKGFNSNLMADKSIAPNITNVDFKSLCKAYLLKYQFTEGSVTQTSAGECPVYIKLGYLLAFLNNMCLLYESIDNKSANSGNSLNTIKPYFYIDFHPEYNLCLTAPQHMTVDPTVCLIPLQATNKQYLELFPADIQALLGAAAFKPETENPFSAFIGSFKTSNAYQGKTMEILLNVQYLLETADRFVQGDKEGAVILKPFLDKVMEDITKSTGGFNLFRVAYRDDSNTVIIKDDQYTPNLPGEASSVLDRSSYKANREYMELQIFGSGSLVRDMEFKTNMSTKMSSMIAISAQSGGQTANSQDATPIGTYNTNYDDAFMTVKLNSLSTGSAITTNTAKQQADDAQKRINTLEEAVKKFNEHVTQVYKNGYVSKVEIPPAVAYYIDRFRTLKGLDPATTAAPFIPANLSLTMDGISGILMGNAFTVPEQRLPASLRGTDGYTKVGFAVVGLSHTLEGNQWLTKVRGQMIKLRDPVNATKTAVVAGVNQSQLPPVTPNSSGGLSTSIKGSALYNDPAFRAKVKKIADSLQLNDEDLIKIMNSESRLDPSAALYVKRDKSVQGPLQISRPKAGYDIFGGGLVGFTAVTLSTIGARSLEEVIQSDALRQLDFVEALLKANAKNIRGGDIYVLYTSFFLPAFIPAVKAGRDSEILKFGNVTAERVSIQNPVIARVAGKPPGSPVTVGDWKKYVNSII